MANITEL